MSGNEVGDSILDKMSEYGKLKSEEQSLYQRITTIHGRLESLISDIPVLALCELSLKLPPSYRGQIPRISLSEANELNSRSIRASTAQAQTHSAIHTQAHPHVQQYTQQPPHSPILQPSGVHPSQNIHTHEDMHVSSAPTLFGISPYTEDIKKRPHIYTNNQMLPSLVDCDSAVGLDTSIHTHTHAYVNGGGPSGNHTSSDSVVVIDGPTSYAEKRRMKPHKKRRKKGGRPAQSNVGGTISSNDKGSTGGSNEKNGPEKPKKASTSDGLPAAPHTSTNSGEN